MADDVVTPASSLFEALAESAPDAIITIDGNSTILSANAAVRRIFQYEPDELLGRPLTTLMPERLRHQHEGGLARYLKSGVKRIPWTGTRLTGLRKDGTDIPIEVSFGEFVDESGRRVFSGFIRDISEQLRQQGALDLAREDLQLQNQLFAAVEQAVISTAPDGVVLTWNRFAEQVYGWKAAEAIGRNLGDLLDPVREFEDEERRPIQRLRAGEKVNYKRRVRHRGGDTIWVAVVAAPLRDEHGNIARFVGTSVDISDRQTLETQLLQAQKLDAVGRLASGVAHDFNNVLTVILSNAELAASEAKPGSAQAEDIAEVIKAAQRGAALARQLLNFNRREQTALRALDPGKVIVELERMLRRLIGANIQIRQSLDANTPQVMADVGKLEQVLTNLVVNARDAMPAGGVITIRTERHELCTAGASAGSGRTPGTYAKISVCDTGHGMSADVRARVFEPFFTTKAEGKGSGLGLATTYGIVAQLGGFIEVESELGEGTQFYIYLPATGQPTSSVGQPPT
jgi:two-component system cell cycle sensor histidine kinase/response regulator CckA